MDGWMLVVFGSALTIVLIGQIVLIWFLAHRLFRSHDRAVDQALAISEANLMYMRYEYDQKVAEVELGHQEARRKGRFETVPNKPKEPVADMVADLGGGGIG